MEEKVRRKTGGEKAPPDIRKTAEKRLSGSTASPEGAAGRSPGQLVHELQVQRIELEMQNDALRKSQRSLEESRDRFSDLYDFAPVGYLTLTKQGIIVEGNLTGAAILRIDRRDLIDSRFRKFVADDALERWDWYFNGVLHTSERRVCELKLRKCDGSLISSRLECIRFGREGDEPVVRATISDISDRVRVEEILVRKSHDFDELNAAYGAIAAGQQELRRTISELSARESELKEALAEKEVLIAEIHHRVKNNLTAFISLLSMEGAYDATPAGLAVKTDLQNRARSMALVHEVLYQTKKYSQVDMDVYLRALAAQVAGTFPGSSRIRLEVRAAGVTLDIARATTCGLIVNELLSNAFRYAFPDTSARHSSDEPCTIRVAMSSVGGRYLLEVGDNGKGLPEGFDPQSISTLGIRLVNFLAKHQLKATVALEPGRGTEFAIRFEVPKTEGKETGRDYRKTANPVREG